MVGRLTAVIGGQYGSEGKGTIVASIANRYGAHVRVGSHNAGHSFRIAGSPLGEGLRTWKMQQIPVGWINPDAVLIIGRGALVDPDTLMREIRDIEVIDPTIWTRLHIDARAGVIMPWHHDEEGGVEGELHQRIGSTGEGVGSARIDRLHRNPKSFILFKELASFPAWRHFSGLLHDDTPGLIRELLASGTSVLLEGSQGVHLSLIHGPWPYVTTTDCGAAQLCADVGVPPMRLTDVICVLRTFPIRVAGNSGPMENEITWKQLSQELGKDVSERTTVTKKIRRVARWDSALVDATVTLNAPTSFAVNFLDYLDPANEGVSEWHRLTPATREWIKELERRHHIPVDFMGTGGPGWTVIPSGRF